MAEKYRVDNIPRLLKPWFLIYGYGIGLIYFGYFCVVHWTSRIEFEGHEPMSRDRNRIYCLWHQNFLPYFCVFLRHERHAWINHPTWNMKPIQVSMRLAGIDKLILGSTGHGGREAAEALTRDLRSGYSTVIAPDGPSGPAKVLKRGVLHLASQSGVRIVPLHFQVSRYWELGTWDNKRLPQPFSKIRVTFGRPILVREDRFELAANEIVRAL